MKKSKVPNLKGASRAKLAEYYRVSEMTISRWVRKGAPLERPEEMVLFGLNLQRRSEGFDERLREISDGMPKRIDPDWIAFRACKCATYEQYMAEMLALGASPDEIRQGVLYRKRHIEESRRQSAVTA